MTPKLEAEIAASWSRCKYKMGACIVKDDKVLSVMCNEPFTVLRFHKYYAPYCKTLHAEAAAILKVKDKRMLKGSTIHVYRRKGSFIAMAKPCSGCQAIIKAFKIKDVWYTTEEGWKHYVI